MKTKPDDDGNKRKRDESSVSELESSMHEDASAKTKATQKSEKQKQKKKKEIEIETVDNESEILAQMRQINSKLNKLDDAMKVATSKLGEKITRGDGSLRGEIKELLIEMKEDLLQSVIKRVDILESKIFDKDLELDQIKANNKLLEQKIEDQKDTFDTNIQTHVKTIERLQREMYQDIDLRRKFENEVQQGRKANNIRIYGVEDQNKRESTTETAHMVVGLLKKHQVITIQPCDIVYAYRIPNRKKTCRDILVTFVSQYTKIDIMRNRKQLKGSGVYINDDLTRLNLEVLMSVKKKMPDEVQEAWTNNGRILMKNTYGRISEVRFEDFDHWLELPWPTKGTGRITDNAVEVD